MDETVKQISVDPQVDPATLPTRDVQHWQFIMSNGERVEFDIRPDCEESCGVNTNAGVALVQKRNAKREVIFEQLFNLVHMMAWRMEKGREPIYPEGQTPREKTIQQLAYELQAAEKRISALAEARKAKQTPRDE